MMYLILIIIGLASNMVLTVKMNRRVNTEGSWLMRGKKEYNPNWKYLAEWAYFKAPTTKRHRFSTHNHNWTAGVLYDRDACWVGCREYSVQCLVPRVRWSKQSCIQEHV